MLWQDFYALFTLRSNISFFKFWRIYDFLMHIILVTGLILRVVKINSNDALCDDNILIEECEHIRKKKEILNDLEGKYSRDQNSTYDYLINPL